jgi:hypothetical protein
MPSDEETEQMFTLADKLMKNSKKMGIMRIGMICDKMQICVHSRVSDKDFGKYVKLLELIPKELKEAKMAYIEYLEDDEEELGLAGRHPQQAMPRP